MEGNMCANCYSLLFTGGVPNYIQAVNRWDKECVICKSTAVFYVRPDEIEAVKKIVKRFKDGKNEESKE